MTRIEAMTAFSALDTPALYAEMQRRGIASPDFDAACKWAEKSTKPQLYKAKGGNQL